MPPVNLKTRKNRLMNYRIIDGIQEVREVYSSDLAHYPALNERKDWGYVYIAEFDEQTVKIGSTSNPSQRLETLMYMSYRGIKPTGRALLSKPHSSYSKNERRLHELFDDIRVPGTELFKAGIFEITKRLNKINLDVSFHFDPYEVTEPCKQVPKTYSKEDLAEAERLAKLLSSFPKDKQKIVVMCANAFIAGLSTRKAIEE